VARLRRAGENGGREDVRWLALSDEQGAGVAAIALGGQAIHFNVSRCAGQRPAHACCRC